MIVSSEQVATWFESTALPEIVVAHQAAEAYIADRCVIPELVADEMVPPAALVQAVRLLTARYLARRNSPDGTLGMSEFGVGRIATIDRDVQQLIAPYRRVVFG